MAVRQIDTTNYFGVSVVWPDGIMIMIVPGHMTKAAALGLAAWLVALADDDNQFPAILEAVRNT